MEIIEDMLQMIKKHLPPSGTELGCYTFLSSNDIWTGTVEHSDHFAVVAEDLWSCGGGFLIVVMADGPVYIAELNGDTVKPNRSDILNLEQDNLIDYCAADFPKFTEILKLYQETLKNTPSPDVFDDEGFEKCEEAEKIFRQQVEKIDPAAIEDPNGLWSGLIEELGAGMV